jgi:GNAT superfamily N-acetyltransferase
MKIRKARLTDAAVIADFNSRLAWETEQLRLNSAIVNRGVRALLKDAAKGTYFVAEENGAVIGQLLITCEWSDWRNGFFWWIQSVYVAAEFRSGGVFRALFGQVQKLAKSRRDVCGLRLYVEKNNRRAQQAYDRLGMKHTHYQIYETSFR